MRNLPSELIEDILRRLPVKSLKRFRSVAKAWCSLIDSDRFIKMHLRHSLTSLSNRHLITGGAGVCSVALDSLDKAHAVKPPFDCKSGDMISYSCNGIFLLMSDPPVLWNPFSREYRVLPDCPVEYAATAAECYCNKAGYEFGYDSRNDDYKVIRVLDFRHKITHAPMANETKIYSLKSNSWRRIEPLPYPLLFLRLNWRVHVNGVLHTLVPDPDNVYGASIMCFSFETERRYQMLLPRRIRIKGFDVSLDVTGGCLSVVCNNLDMVVVWVMKEYGVNDSWVKLVSVTPPVFEGNDYVKPLVYSKEGGRVLLLGKTLFWYDLRNQSVDYVFIEGLPFVFYAEACVESLVSLGGEIKNWGCEKEKRKDKTTKKRDDFLSKGFKLVL
ncbi:hypothetical protein ABFS82_08G154100 [Erythranthe guttata]